MPLFTKSEYQEMAQVVFDPSYPGLLQKEEILDKEEIPDNENFENFENSENFDKKQTSFISEGYLSYFSDSSKIKIRFREFLERGYNEALKVFEKEQLPEYVRPSYEMCSLKVLKYNPGDFTKTHCDPNLFTISLYRDPKRNCVYYDNNYGYVDDNLYHYARILNIEGLRPKSLHSVISSDDYQESILFVAMPDKNVVLKNGQTISEYLHSVFKSTNFQDNTKGQIGHYD